MAALVQSFPPSTSTLTINASQSQQHQRGSPMARNLYNTSVGGMGGMGGGSYRGHSPLAPVAPYAFTSTPVILNTTNPLRQHPTAPVLRQENRTTSAPTVPSHSSHSSPTTYTNTAKPSPDRYRRSNRRPEPAVSQPASPSLPNGPISSPGSTLAPVAQPCVAPTQPSTSSTPTLTSYPAFRGGSTSSQTVNDLSPASTVRLLSVDDLSLPRQTSTVEQAKRYRRRSISSLEMKEHAAQTAELKVQPSLDLKSPAPASGASEDQSEAQRPLPAPRASSSHGRNDSKDSTGSTSTSSIRSGSGSPASKRDFAVTMPPSPVLQATPVLKNEARLVNIPPRGSSEASRRLANPSPLSKPLTMSPENTLSKDSFVDSKPIEPLPAAVNTPNISTPESPAAQQLAALNKKDVKKDGKSSRLRRAFSFGSAAELRKASAENNMASNERAKLRKERYHNEQEAAQARIAQKQEAAGLGEGIYSGQGHFFTGSTDNLSISSTASSASVMIRKMGKGMKKGSRSLVGLFRPKSVIGVPAADSAVPEPSVAQVSMVTVEAEREKVNVNVDPHDHPGGGTGYPKLERNSIDAASISNEISTAPQHVSNDNYRPRVNIIGGDKERAEVLSSVKKGILKRTAAGSDSGDSSPVTKPADAKASEFNAPQLPPFNDSPKSSAPSTPTDEIPRLGHRRTDSVTIEGEDYFMSLAKFASGDSKSIPGTPRSIAARNISFSPRIQFHDTWPSGEYDRRGEIATCNRLTPMLAQQIKEELNTFKMEMEVHEQSKVYTHFF